MNRNLVAMVVLLSCSVLLPAPADAGWRKPSEITIRGRVTDSQGLGVAGVPVRVLATRRVVRFLTVESRPAETEIKSASTDSNGFYEFTMSKMRDYDFYFLRFYNATDFDGVRFTPPPDVEITSRISKRRPVVEDLALADSAQWDAVQRLVALYGEDTTRGRIVRDLGVPDRTQRRAGEDGVERETWWFDSAGVAYIIENGRVIQRKTFQAETGSQDIARQ